MLIVKARVSSADALKSVAGIVRGDVVAVDRDGEDFVAKLVVHHEGELEKLHASGVPLEILLDSRKRPDPREEVSKVDRYADELARWKRDRGKA